MKIRIGFVSNSSSSSFCIYGACFSKSDLFKHSCPEHAGDVLRKDEECKACAVEDDTDAVDTYVSEMVRDTKLHYVYDYDNGEVYIGRNPDDIGDNETGGEFRRGIKAEIERIFDKTVECRTHEGEIQC